MWRAWNAGDAEAYLEYLKATRIKDSRERRGNEGGYILRPRDKERCEFVTMTIWTSLAPARASGGTETDTALVHLRRERYQDLLLIPARDSGGGPKEGARVMFAAYDADLEALPRCARTVGTGTAEGPAPTCWNTVDLVARDPDGYENRPHTCRRGSDVDGRARGTRRSSAGG